jgi:uncharacterized membrane protein
MRSPVVLKELAAVLALVLCGCGGGESGPPAEPEVTGTVAWCEVSAVLSAKCAACHVGQGQHGAPFPLLTFEDTQVVEAPRDKPIWELMQAMVEAGAMPPTESPLVGPSGELTEAERLALGVWFDEGARAVGGRDCR